MDGENRKTIYGFNGVKSTKSISIDYFMTEGSDAIFLNVGHFSFCSRSCACVGLLTYQKRKLSDGHSFQPGNRLRQRRKGSCSEVDRLMNGKPTLAGLVNLTPDLQRPYMPNAYPKKRGGFKNPNLSNILWENRQRRQRLLYKGNCSATWFNMKNTVVFLSYGRDLASTYSNG